MKFESSQRSHIKEARLRKLKRAFCFYINPERWRSAGYPLAKFA
jgi:hypothetical protein